MSAWPFLLGSRTRLWFSKSEMKNFSAVARNLKDILVVLYRGALTERNVNNWKPARTFRLLLFHNRIRRIYWGRSGTAEKENVLPYNLSLYFAVHLQGVTHIHIIFGNYLRLYFRQTLLLLTAGLICQFSVKKRGERGKECLRLSRADKQQLHITHLNSKRTEIALKAPTLTL